MKKNQKSFSIRTATRSDVLSILGLLYEMGRPRPKTYLEKARFKKKILQYITDRDKKILVATNHSKIVGMVSIMLLSRLNRMTPELYIPELVVSKAYRRLGIGRSLIKSCIGTAKKNNCYRIRLESGKKRVEAHKFYPRMGFEQSALSYNLNLK